MVIVAVFGIGSELTSIIMYNQTGPPIYQSSIRTSGGKDPKAKVYEGIGLKVYFCSHGKSLGTADEREVRRFISTCYIQSLNISLDMDPGDR